METGVYSKKKIPRIPDKRFWGRIAEMVEIAQKSGAWSLCCSIPFPLY